MKLIYSTFIILILKVAVFTLGLSLVNKNFPERTWVICSVFIFFRCVIFKYTQDQETNFLNHGDFLSDFPSLAFFYFFHQNFKSALYFHLSFGSLHYFQYVFGFIIPSALELIWEAIKAIFTRIMIRPKKVSPRIEPQVIRSQPSPPPEPPPIETKVTLEEEERPIPIKNGPKERPSIYEI